MTRHLVWLCGFLSACAPAVTQKTSAKAPLTHPSAAREQSDVQPRLPTQDQTQAATPSAAPRLEFVENDFPRALALAAARKVPVFVDAWAPWCHTCLSLREFVLEDPSLRPLADKFVFAAIDTELDANRQFVEAYAQKNWPTLWVIDAASQKPLLKWVGALTVNELRGMLESVVDTSASAGTREALAAWVRGQGRFSDGDLAGAIAAYETALKVAPPDWAERGLVVDALLARLSEARRFADCAHGALAWAPELPPGSAKVDAFGIGLGCALELKGREREALLAKLLPLVTELLADARSSALADDRSGLYDTLVSAYQALKRDADAKLAAERWAAFLEEQAAKAATPAQRAVFDSHRLAAYLSLQRFEQARDMLLQSERDLPSDYNPPARLARVYFEMKQLPEAERAITRALARAYGPRKLRLFMLQEEILRALGRSAEARAVLETALEFGKTLSLPGGYADLYRELQLRLARATAAQPAPRR